VNVRYVLLEWFEENQIESCVWMQFVVKVTVIRVVD
jgi:hypothetical protein